ncbi:Alpha-tocopherol transfer protein [Eumeta japonica]|uniref:Alpha-tocopherol transfer protein n=1 Tax=Eumeta variegata TaxID=151549 RepID=A0A4C1VRG1_EUMVA|nr:Alpha-tocopherol transfer protein [Eumeta japonica]
MPLRLKGSHHVNLPASVESIFSLLKSMLTQKARDRFEIHKNYEDLHQSISKEVLPAEYGGTGGTIAEIAEYWVQKIEEYKSWMQQELSFGTDESKRPGRPTTAADMFGVEGSFRKLELD